MSPPTSPFARRRWLLLLVVLALGLATAFALFAVRVSALRAGRATGPNWRFPARVYSDAVPLVPGRILPAEVLAAELAARDYAAVSERPSAPGTYARTGDQFEIVLRGFTDALDPAGNPNAERVHVRIEDGRVAEVQRPDPAQRRDAPGAARGKASRDASPTDEIPARLEPVQIAWLLDDDRTWRSWVDLERVPKEVRDAIVASEDRRFESHVGIDLRGYLRALVANARAGQVREGGSTITQQLARSLFLGRERTLARKLAEVPLALGLELVLGKRRILEMYLNSVYWGQGAGTSIGGVAAASRWYFGAPVESLGVLEGATLAAMIPAPNVFDPFERPELVRKRRNQVLREMVESKRLAAPRAAALAEEPLRLRRTAPEVDRFPSYTSYVRDQLGKRFHDEALTTRGLAVFTRLDLVWQREAEDGLADAVATLDPGGKPRLEGAFVAIEPGTGNVRAMVGGRTPRSGAFNRAFQARRQTGSAIKPIVYAAALASGRGFTPATVVPDVPRTFATDLGPWTPKNDDGTSHTQVTLIKALERSLNVATTNLVDLVGPREIARCAQAFGLGTFKPVMSIGLGSNETTLIDLTRAFAVFGDGGVLRRATPLRAVIDRSGRDRLGATAAERGPAMTRVLPEPVAALMTGMLTNVVRFGVAYPLRKTYAFVRPAAGKTGTTDEYKDAWFVGFTPDIVAGTWIGYDRPRSLGRLAADTALPTWARIVVPLLRPYPPREFTSETKLEWKDLEPWTGLLATRDCTSQPVPFLPGTAPRAYCPPGTPMGPEFDVGDSSAAADSVATGE